MNDEDRKWILIINLLLIQFSVLGQLVVEEIIISAISDGSVVCAGHTNTSYASNL